MDDSHASQERTQEERLRLLKNQVCGEKGKKVTTKQIRLLLESIFKENDQRQQQVIVPLSSVKTGSLDIAAFVDASGSMHGRRWNYAFNVLVDIRKGLLSETKDADVGLALFGVDDVIDPRNNQFGYSLLGLLSMSARERDKLVNGITCVTSLQHSSKILKLGVREERKRGKLLLMVCDGAFSGGPHCFSDFVDHSLKNGTLDAVDKIIIVFPPSVKQRTVKSVALAVSSVLEAVKSRMVTLTCIRKDCHLSAYEDIQAHLNYMQVPEGCVMLGDGTRSGSMVVLRKASASQISTDMLSGGLDRDAVKKMATMMLETAKTNPRVLLTGQYAKLHEVLSILSKRTPFVHEVYTTPLSKVTGDVETLQEMRAIARRGDNASSCKINAYTLAIVCKRRMYISPHDQDGNKITNKNLRKMINNAISDGSSIELLKMIKLLFGRNSKIHFRQDPKALGGEDGGLAIPDPKRCSAGAITYREALFKSFKSFFLCLGPQFTEKLTGQRLFALLLLIRHAEIEVPGQLRQLVGKLLIDEAYICRNMGVEYADEHQKKVCDVRLPDSVYAPRMVNLLNDFIRSDGVFVLCESSSILRQVKDIVRALFQVYAMAKAYRTILSNRPATRVPYNVPLVDEQVKTPGLIFAWVLQGKGTWVDPSPRIPSFAFLGSMDPNINPRELGYDGLVSENVRMCTWMDNPNSPEILELFEEEACKVFKHRYGEDNAKARRFLKKAMASFMHSLHVPVGTDVAHIPIKRLVPCIQLKSVQDREKFSTMIFALFARWRAEDINIDMDEDTCRALRASREAKISEVIQKFKPETETKSYTPTEDQHRDILHAVYPHLKPFQGYRYTRSNAEDILIGFLEAGVLEEPIVATPRLECSKNPHFTQSAAFYGTSVPVNMCAVRKDMVDCYEKITSPAPILESDVCGTCSVCLNDFGRENRKWIPCGHVICNVCVGEVCRQVESSIQEGLNLPINLCMCPICRQFPIVPREERFMPVFNSL